MKSSEMSRPVVKRYQKLAMPTMTRTPTAFQKYHVENSVSKKLGSLTAAIMGPGFPSVSTLAVWMA